MANHKTVEDNLQKIKNMKIYTPEDIINILRDWQFVNPNLVSDGRGEFSDVYKLTEDNLKSLSKLLK